MRLNMHGPVALFVAAVATMLLLPVTAAAQPYWSFSWSAIGAAGVVDESSTGLIAFDGASALLPPAAPPGSNAVMRFALPPMPGYRDQWVNCLSGPCHVSGGESYTHLRLTLRFRKNDDSAWVMATLRRVRLADGVIGAMASVNSLAFNAGAQVQLVQQAITCADTCLDPWKYAYFIEVPIAGWTTASVPQALGVQIELGYDYD